MAADDVVTAGGRVLCVTALGSGVTEAQARAYERLQSVTFAGAEYRTDIGYRAVEREATQSTEQAITPLRVIPRGVMVVPTACI